MFPSPRRGGVEWDKRLERHAAAAFVNLFLYDQEGSGRDGGEGEDRDAKMRQEDT